MSIAELYDMLENIICRENTVIVCIGSPLRMDDRAGLIICDHLLEKGFKQVIKCEYGLENCFSELSRVKNSVLLIIDAVYSDKLSPGDIILIDEDAILGNTSGLKPITTHNIPFNTIVAILKELAGIEKIYLLGIMIKKIDLGIEISEEVGKSIDKIVSILENILDKCRSLRF